MADDKKRAEWVTGTGRRYVLHPDDTAELDRDAGVHEFVSMKPRDEAESLAYTDYRNKHHSKAAAYHLALTRASHAAGDVKAAKRHKLLYDLHLKALGYDPDQGKVPDSVQHAVESPTRETGIRFRPHKADAFLFEKNEKGEYAILAKKEPKSLSEVYGKLKPKKRKQIHENLKGMLSHPGSKAIRGTIQSHLDAISSVEKAEALIDHKQVVEGSADEEKEHGLGPDLSTKIAVDHLAEDPNYYKKDEKPPMSPPNYGNEPINYNNVEQLRAVFGEAVPKDFHPANAAHWGQFINSLSPAQKHFVMKTLFEHDRWASKQGMKPATGPALGQMPLPVDPVTKEWKGALAGVPDEDENTPSAAEKLGTQKNEVGASAAGGESPPTNQGELLMSEAIHKAYAEAPSEVKKSVMDACKGEVIKTATLATIEVTLRKAIAAKVVNPSALAGRAGVLASPPPTTPEKPRFTLDHLKAAYHQQGIKPPLGSVARKDEMVPHAGDVQKVPAHTQRLPKHGDKLIDHAGNDYTVTYGYPGYAGGVMVRNNKTGVQEHVNMHSIMANVHASGLRHPEVPLNVGALYPDLQAQYAAKKEELDPNKIKVRDEGIRRGKLPPGAPGADKYGAGTQEDKKKQADKDAARKWRPDDE